MLRFPLFVLRVRCLSTRTKGRIQAVAPQHLEERGLEQKGFVEVD